MKPVMFPESNATLGAPRGMTTEQCADLPVYRDGNTCLSCWEPTESERQSLLNGGKVWLWVLSGPSQPAVALAIGKDVDEAAELSGETK